MTCMFSTSDVFFHTNTLDLFLSVSALRKLQAVKHEDLNVLAIITHYKVTQKKCPPTHDINFNSHKIIKNMTSSMCDAANVNLDHSCRLNVVTEIEFQSHVTVIVGLC